MTVSSVSSSGGLRAGGITPLRVRSAARLSTVDPFGCSLSELHDEQMPDGMDEPTHLRGVRALDRVPDASEPERAQRVLLALVGPVGRLDLLDGQRAHAGISSVDSSAGASGSSAAGASAAGSS